MKKVIISVLSIFAFGAVQQVFAQDNQDALRYSSEKLNGTARFTAMAGAFGALGGDISALKVNPAGSSIFLANSAAISLDNLTYNNDVGFGNGFRSKKNNKIDLNQIGAVWVFNNYNEDVTMNKFALGVTYEKTNDFANRYVAQGNSGNSISDYFVDLANGVPLDLFSLQNSESFRDLYTYLGETDFSDQGFNNNELQTAYLGYESFVFDSSDNTDFNNTNYTSNVSGNNFQHQYAYAATGLNGKFSANASLALQDRFYLGINLNGHFINYDRTTSYFEGIADPSQINEIYFKNTLNTLGTGFSFQVGGIAKINQMFRVGATYESPTWFTISEETSQSLRTYNQSTDDLVLANPSVINVYPDYNLRTPGKITGSLAVIFGKNGLLSFDYSYKDYANMKYDSNVNNISFADQNESIKNTFQGVSTYRIGGEYRLNHWSLRGGYRYEESPYKNDDLMSALNGYSGGLGYNFGNIKLGFAYDYAQRDYKATLQQTGLSEMANVDNSLSHYVLTLNFAL